MPIWRAKSFILLLLLFSFPWTSILRMLYTLLLLIWRTTCILTRLTTFVCIANFFFQSVIVLLIKMPVLIQSFFCFIILWFYPVFYFSFIHFCFHLPYKASLFKNYFFLWIHLFLLYWIYICLGTHKGSSFIFFQGLP